MRALLFALLFLTTRAPTALADYEAHCVGTTTDPPINVACVATEDEWTGPECVYVNPWSNPPFIAYRLPC